jgi:hypothetical protein
LDVTTVVAKLQDSRHFGPVMPIEILCPPVSEATPWLAQYAPAFSALAVLVVGAIAASIAYRQWVTAHTKLQLELYDKRQPIYLATKNALFSVGEGDSGLVAQVLHDFRGALLHAPFLYGPDVRDLMGQLSDDISARLKWEKVSPETKSERGIWEDTWIARIDAAFTPYLQLEARTSRSRR